MSEFKMARWSLYHLIIADTIFFVESVSYSLGSPVASLNAGAIILGHQLLVIAKMLMEWLKHGLGPSSLILRQWDKTPTHRARLLLRAVIDILPVEDQLLFPGQRKIHLAVADSDLIGSVEGNTNPGR